MYNDARHSYHVVEGDETFKVPSVTTICGIIDKSPALVPWAANTTAAAIKASILPDVAYDEVFLASAIEVARNAHRAKKEEAANIGTQAHHWLEAYFKHGVNADVPDDERVQNCIYAALEWLDTHSVQKIDIEKRIYSRQHRFSGTLDKLALVDGVRSLIDWKSSKDIYPEHRLQTSAYVGAYEEEGFEPVLQRFLIKLGKEDGHFEAHSYDRSTQDHDYSTFLHALGLYNGLKGIK